MAFCGNCGAGEQSSKYCTQCGEASNTTSASPAKATVAPRAVAKVSTLPSECPACYSDSAVQRTSAVIESGSTSTRGAALSAPIGGGQWTATGFGSQSTSGLAYRLSSPSQPRARVWPWLLLFWALLAWSIGKWSFDAIQYESAGVFFGPDTSKLYLYLAHLTFGLIIGGFPAIGLAYIMRPIAHATWLKMAREDWVPRATRIYNSYYCFRDDTMFDRGYGGRPEQFIGNAFS